LDNSCNKFNAVIHTECTSAEECEKWISVFADSSLCTWRVRKTYPYPLRGIVYKKTIFASTARSTSPILHVATRKPLDVVPDSL